MYRLTADSCPDGPCPRMALDEARGKVAIQTYDLPPDADRSRLPRTPKGEHLGEMDVTVLEALLAEHLTDEALARIVALRAAR